MAFQLSPGVNISEVDLTTVVPSVATTIGGLAGAFTWGPANEITIISDETQLVDRFGRPDANTYQTFFTAANFLSYGSDLRIVRAVGAGAKNASSSSNTANTILIENITDYEQNHSANSNTAFHAKWAGELGNSIRVEMADANTYTSWSAYKAEFDSAPATSTYASQRGASNDEMHIVVIDVTGKISGTANTILEKWGYVSKASDAKNSDGTSNYYKEVVNSRSKYIWWGGHLTANAGVATANALSYGNLVSTFTSTFTGGLDDTPTAANINTAYDKFANPDAVDVSLLMAGATTGTTIPNYLIALAETRKDCMVFVSPSMANVVNNSNSESTSVIATAATYTKSSYAVMDSGYKYQYDKYNDVYRWVPLNGDIAGLCVRTDNERDPWFSPAGLNRGVIKNVVKLAWNPTKAQRDELYKAGVNSVVTFPGEGTILYGDKTLLNRPSAFDRINVRRLFIVLEKSITKAARSSLFEFNDEFTRAAFVNIVEPFLRDVQGRRGIYDYRVVADTTNNTAEVIDQNQFVGDIYIKPARSINFIQLNFTAVRTGVAFEEIVGRV